MISYFLFVERFKYYESNLNTQRCVKEVDIGKRGERVGSPFNNYDVDGQHHIQKSTDYNPLADLTNNCDLAPLALQK